MEGITEIARFMAIAATTAPQSIGEEFVRTRVLQGHEIQELEKSAGTCLHEQGDIDQYTANLHSNAVLLSELSDLARPYLQDLPAEQQEKGDAMRCHPNRGFIRARTRSSMPCPLMSPIF